jgi:hypothetical protein
MNNPIHFFFPAVLIFTIATIASINDTFGGVKPDLTVRDLIPGQPVSAQQETSK